MKTIEPLHNIESDDNSGKDNNANSNESAHQTTTEQPASEDIGVGAINNSFDANTIYPVAVDKISASYNNSEAINPSKPDKVDIYFVGFYVFASLFLIANIPFGPLGEILKGHLTFNVQDTISLLVFFTAIGLFFRKEWARLVVVICIVIFILLSLLLMITVFF